MSWMDEEIDSVFKEAANQPTFEYRPEYWNDIEKQLPVNKKRKSFVWWWTSGVFLIGILTYSVLEYNTNEIQDNNSAIGETELESQTLKQTDFTKTKASTLSNSFTSKTPNKEANSDLKKINFQTGQSQNTNSQPVNLEINVTELHPSELEDEPIPLHDNLEVELSGVLNEAPINSEEEINLKVKPLIVSENEVELIQSARLEMNKNRKDFYVEMNGGVGQEFTKNDPAEVNAMYGLSFGVKFPVNKFTLNAGIGYQGIKFSNLNIKDRTLIYGLGSKTLENSYVFSSIHALQLPVALNYSFKRHSISLGITSSINFVTRLKHSQSLDGERTLYESGISDVSFFNRFSVQPSFGYSFFVNERTQIGMRLNIELLDQLKSDRFIGDHTKMPFNGQVYLRRTLDF